MLVQRSRQLKETLLGPAAPERLTLSLPWSGSRLIGGARQVEVQRSEIHDLLVEGFFPLVPLDARPNAPRFRIPGIRTAVRARPGGYALPGGLPYGAPPRGHGGR